MIIRHIRNWLRTASKRNDLPGAIIMQNEYKKIARTIPALAKEMGEKPEDIPYNDYCAIMESAVKEIQMAKCQHGFTKSIYYYLALKIRMIKTSLFSFIIFTTKSAFVKIKWKPLKRTFQRHSIRIFLKSN